MMIHGSVTQITPVNLKKIDLHGKKVQCAER